MGYLSGTLDSGLAMLANIAAFRTWCGATDAADALANYIVKIDKGAAITKTRYAKAGIAADPDEEPALGVIRRSGEIGISFWRDDVNGETAQARAEDLLDLADAVRSRLYTLRGTSTYLARFIVDIGEPQAFTREGAAGHKSMIPIFIRYRG